MKASRHGSRRESEETYLQRQRAPLLPTKAGLVCGARRPADAGDEHRGWIKRTTPFIRKLFAMRGVLTIRMGVEWCFLPAWRTCTT